MLKGFTHFILKLFGNQRENKYTRIFFNFDFSLFDFRTSYAPQYKKQSIVFCLKLFIDLIKDNLYNYQSLIKHDHITGRHIRK